MILILVLFWDDVGNDFGNNYGNNSGIDSVNNIDHNLNYNVVNMFNDIFGNDVETCILR